MESKIIITSRNRDGAAIWLNHLNGNEYTIETDKQYVLEYCCCNYDSLPEDATEYDFASEYNGRIIKGNYVSYDPAGGPYMNVGSTIDYEGKYILERVYVKDSKTIFVIKEK